MAYPATPKTWVAGDVLTAAQLNAELRDALLGAFSLGPPDSAWTGFTPTLVQSGAVTKTSTYAKYTRVGRTIKAAYVLTCTGAGTAANPVTIGLPVPAAQTSLLCVGSGWIFDASANLMYRGVAEITGASTFAFRDTMSTVATLFLGATGFTAALASSDIISGTVTYEAAT